MYGGVLPLFVKFSRSKKIEFVKFHIPGYFVFGKKNQENMEDWKIARNKCGNYGKKLSEKNENCTKNMWKLWEKISPISLCNFSIFHRYSYRRAFFPIISTFFSCNLSLFHIFLFFPPNMWNSTKLIFLLGENFVLIGELPFSIVSTFFRAIFQSSKFSCSFFPNMWNLTNLFFLLLENFTNRDRTPPYIDTHLQLSQTLEIMGKTLSDKNDRTQNDPQAFHNNSFVS